MNLFHFLWSDGLVHESYSVTVVRFDEEPTPLVLDTIVATEVDDTIAFLALGDHWYICREHD